MTKMHSIPMGPKPRLSARRRAVLALIAAGAVAAGAVQLGSATGAEPAKRVTTIHYTSVTDFSNDKRLAGFAEHVFFGRVSAAGRTLDKGEALPETEFPVQVLSTLKGSAATSATVVQQGGEVPGVDDQMVQMEGDKPLQSGRTYLFATRSDPQGRRFLVPQYGDLLVRDAAHQEQLRERFAAAVQNQIPFS
jgi:hypothetical protein